VSRISIAAACVLLVACTAADKPDNAAALADIRAGTSGDEVVVAGTVTRTYSEASGASGTHERFEIRIDAAGQAQDIFVADNVTVGETAPLKPGDSVIVKGVLAIDPSGPVIHWTHHDPRLRHPAGFVEVGGRIYD
jgi:hypothetical protein